MLYLPLMLYLLYPREASNALSALDAVPADLREAHDAVPALDAVLAVPA